MEEYSHDLEKDLEALEMELQALNEMRNDLLKRVSKEEGRGLQVLPEVREWVSVVEEIEAKAIPLLDKSISQLQKLSKYDDISHISALTHQYSEAVGMTLKEVETHKSKGVFKELVERAPLPYIKKMPPLQKIASREMLFEKAWKRLAENECRTTALYGMAGVGKTTLLTHIKNKFIEVGYVPSLVILVVVKSEKVESIQDEIGERLGVNLRGEEKEKKASDIFKFLYRKRFVLLLDGIQRKVDFEEIGIPQPSKENGCKIVFTTRSQEARGSKWVDAVEEVECLSSEESWDLFRKTVGETSLKSHPDIPQLARIVARKCSGLPITLNLIGKIMSSKKTVREWRHAIHALVSPTAGYPDREVSILKFTYDYLPDEIIKSCFLYCALFPKNSDISKQDLVDCWIGEGILEEEEDRETAENKGYEMIGDLVRVGLLMESESGYGVKMQGMVLEMALWVASHSGRGGETFLVQCGEKIHEMPMADDWNTVRRMSVTSSRIETISGSPHCSKLTTLFLQENKNLERISGNFFQWMTSLVVLNLSRNTKLAELPEPVSSLVSLQFLNLSRTWINRLPLGLKELKKLIHLDLDYTFNLKNIEVIASLLNLQVLRLFNSAPMDLSLMESLKLLKSLKELSLTVKEDSIYEWLISSHRLTSCIRRLCLRGIAITDGVILLLNAMFSLRKLDILSCNIPEIAIVWRSSTIRMETVYSSNIGNIPQFRNIRKVSLCFCSGARDLTWLVAAPSLEDLTLYMCLQIERIISKEKAKNQLGHTSEQPFQNLSRLTLNSLPQLESIYWTPLPFPVLEEIVISGCPKIKRLPFNSESAKGNQLKLNLDEEWIKGVEWEDEATKQRFSNFDNRDFVQMAKEQKMVGTTESVESSTTSSISGNKVLQPETQAKYGVSTPDGQISNRIAEFSLKLENNLEVLEMEVERLNAMVNELVKRVSKEKERGLRTLPEVKDWITKAEEIESKASSLLDESISECYNLSKNDDISHISASTHQYSEAVGMTLKEVETHKSKGVFKELVERAPLPYIKKTLPLQKIASREMLLEKAWKCLVENECLTLALYGMAGVGKTTLLTQIKNKFIEVGNAPSFVIFVAVEFEEAEGIQDNIRKILGLYGRKKSEQEKASEIYEFLNRKRFVLLLDGIQKRVDLEEIGVPQPSKENGCKIVFTTHSEEACESKWVDVVEEVKCLSPEESWDLFQKIVGETTLKSHPDLSQLARIVARKCGGLPIALNLIGRTMSCKRTIREWHHAIHALVSSTTEFSGRQVSILKFAYDNLPGENVKSCVQYCALFPRNCDISKQELVDCLIGENIIVEEDREIAEIKGYGMIGDLVKMGLLLENESGYGVRVHDMVHEVALSLASQAPGTGRDEKIVVKCGLGIHEMPMVNNWNVVRRMSMTSTQIETISGSPHCPKLTTLFLQGNINLKSISGDFFRWMTSLVVLNLSFNTELVELPEQVSSLVSLQFLNLAVTRINRLPLGLKELKKLIHLDLDYTSNLEEIEVIASLLNLQVLRLLRSVPMDLNLMEDIQRLESLKELSLTVIEDAVFERLLSSHRLASCIRRLRLKYITINNGGLSLLNAMSSLRELDLFRCYISEITIDSTIQMETVHSGNVEKISQFRNIRKVSLHGCNGVRDLTWLIAAPSLDDLILYKCPHLEQVISKEKAMAQLGHTSEQPFQNLTRLTLNDLPKLESIYWTPLPFLVLQDIVISGCPELRRLPINSESAKGNQLRLDLDEEWIKGVEWEDEATKQRFSNLNRRDFPKMDDLAMDSYPIQNKVLTGTIESRESSTATDSTGATIDHTYTHSVSISDDLIGNEIDTNVRKVSTYGISPAYEKIPPSPPFRAPPRPSLVPPSPPRYAMSQGPRYASTMGPLDLTMSQIVAATNSFSDRDQIGEGSFGIVYNGILDNGQVVAIKRAKKEHLEIMRTEFRKQIDFLYEIGHRNLVKLLGYVDKGDELLIISEYLRNGTLRDHLDGARGTVLNFNQRLEIAIHVCRGLTYLHTYAGRQIIHCNVNSSNVLLTDSMRAKLGGFGLARAVPRDSDKSHITTQVRGTFGYMDPEYMKTCQLSPKSDVFSFGILLVEIFTGRRPIEFRRPTKERITVRWAFDKYNDGKVFDLVDPNMKEEIDKKILRKMFSLAFQCAAPTQKERPDMRAVGKQLRAIRSSYLKLSMESIYKK